MKPAQCHFFLSSLSRWLTTGPDLDLPAAMKLMNRDGMTYNLWFVPLPHDAEYEISQFAPMVEGAAWCDTFHFRKRSK